MKKYDITLDNIEDYISQTEIMRHQANQKYTNKLVLLYHIFLNQAYQ